ncbi:MAG: glycosyl hydrolase family 28-related protein [Planctomycetota bacterium]
MQSIPHKRLSTVGGPEKQIISRLFAFGLALMSSGCAHAGGPSELKQDMSWVEMTAADVLGPDGVVYPDFSLAGAPGDIPDIPHAVRAEDFGAVADDGLDDAVAIQAAVDAVAETGKPGAVTLGPGTFHFDATVAITVDGIVIRGAGRVQTTVIPRFDGQDLDKAGSAKRTPVFHWNGNDPNAPRIHGPLTAATTRGNFVIEVEDAGRLEVGDGLEIATRKLSPELEATLSPKLLAKHQKVYNRSVEGNYRAPQQTMNFAKIAAIDGKTVTLDRPLRSDFPLDRQPFFYKRFYVYGGGLESLTITQSDKTKTQIDAVVLERVDGGWVRDVAIGPIGSWPLRLERSVHCEVRDVAFDDTYVRGGGGVGYFGLNFSHYNLVDSSEFHRLRHLSVSFFSSVNVIRNCTLRNVDINFHLDWPAETLIENCDINTGPAPGEDKRGSYGFGFYTPVFHYNQHQPSGPRHVYFGNTVVSPNESVHFGGGGSSWNIFAYNRFVAETRVGVMFRRGSDNNLFLNNDFVLLDYDKDPGGYHGPRYENTKRVDPDFTEVFEYIPGGTLFLSGPAIGNRFINNRFFGVPEADLFVGVDEPAEATGNEAVASVPSTLPDPPTPPFTSLFEWTQTQRGVN